MKCRAFSLSSCLVASVVAAEFHQPVELRAGDEVIRVESPGYASPGFGDVNGDGITDLLVGQFRNGKITVFPGLGGGKFGKGDALMADGVVAEVPGVW